MQIRPSEYDSCILNIDHDGGERLVRSERVALSKLKDLTLTVYLGAIPPKAFDDDFAMFVCVTRIVVCCLDVDPGDEPVGRQLVMRRVTGATHQCRRAIACQ